MHDIIFFICSIVCITAGAMGLRFFFVQARDVEGWERYEEQLRENIELQKQVNELKKKYDERF